MAADRPSAQTLRRLMKEYEAIRSDFAHRQVASSSSSFPDSPTSPSPTSSRAGSPRRTETHTGANDASSRADSHVLELRPWDTDGEDLFEWYALISGPEGGNYAGGHFELSLQVPPTYPSKPPKISFKTRIFHPNVSWTTGEICLDLLSPTSWSPAWRLQSCLTAVLALLEDPEPDSPLNVDAAAVFRTGDRVAYRGLCRMYTLLHAAGPAPAPAHLHAEAG